MPAASQSDCQWLSVTEETLLLHDGLLRVTDLVELPKLVKNGESNDNDVSHVCFASKDPSQLTKTILRVCGTQNNAYSKLVEYRLNALHGLWSALRLIALEEHEARSSATQEETVAILKKQGLIKDQEQASFSTRISLLLILPLLQSLSNSDKALCGVTAKVLLEALKDCPPFSLSREPEECSKGLENLLCDWIEGKCREEAKVSKSDVTRGNQETAASALIALACARGHLETFIHTVNLLQQCPDIPKLPISDLLTRLLDTEGGTGQPSAILGSRHLVSWGYEDMLSDNPPTDTSTDKDAEKETDNMRSIACDGYYLYTTNNSGRGLAKIGSGYHGTLRGYIYQRVVDVGPGRIAWCNGALLYRPVLFDTEPYLPSLAQLLHPATLQPVKTIPRPASASGIAEIGLTTLSFCSDGLNIYHLWTATGPEKPAKGHNVYVDAYHFQANTQTINIHHPRIMLQRKEDSASKNLNETLLSRIRPYRGSSVAQTLIALTGGEAGASKKEEGSSQGGTATSCGVSLKTLMKTPVYCDGSTLVILSPLIAGPTASAARSLFGSGGSLSSLRSLASNLCFNVNDGQFVTRLDLMDAPSCCLAGGASLAKIAVCYDSMNNLVWVSSNDYMDEFSNPGHQAPHHIRHRLSLSPLPRLSGCVSVGEVVRHLLQHVASMCVHQLTSDSLASPFASLITHQCSIAEVHLHRFTSILETGISNHDNHTIVCILVVLQLFFKISAVKEQGCDIKEGLLEHTRSLVWHLLTEYKKKASSVSGDGDSCSSVEREAGQVICVALTALYPCTTDRHQLLDYLLRNANQSDSLDQLRDVLLVDFAEQLKSKMSTSSGADSLRLPCGLVQQILSLAVKHSSSLIMAATAADKLALDEMLSEIPRMSPCVRYLSALQSFLLREILLTANTESNDTQQAQALAKQQEIMKGELRLLAVKILHGTSEVTEVFLCQCERVIEKGGEHVESSLANMERLVKGTMIGQLLPPLLTALTHPSLHDLALTSDLMPLLIRLVVITTQATLLLKTHLESVINKELELSADTDMIGLIPQSLAQQQVDHAESSQSDFLLSMKIPTPWASGKMVETIHPVRDNYKFKETVHIPGARCLYLRFDSRSSSQYDYDKLIVFSGPNTSSKKVSEYGGNTFGFGSRSVLGSGWPKDLVKVEGDTVTFSFEMRSGREHNTPDKAMWGFSVTVRAQESTEEVNSGLPFLADLALGLSNLTCSMLSLMYHGPPPAPEELTCQHLLKAKVLQRCVWKKDVDPPAMKTDSSKSHEQSSKRSSHTFSSQQLSRIKLSREFVLKLRKFTKRPPLKMRPSIKQVLQPEELEEMIVSMVMKHLGLFWPVMEVGKQPMPDWDEDSLMALVLEEAFRRTDALLRQLQTLADLEQRWTSELEDQRRDGGQGGPPFFHDYHLQEMKYKELAMLCYLKDVTVEQTDREYAVKSLMAKFDCELLQLEESSTPEATSESSSGLSSDSTDSTTTTSSADNNTSAGSTTPSARPLDMSSTGRTASTGSSDPEHLHDQMSRTHQVVEALFSRLDLLLHVSIDPPDTPLPTAMSRSMSTFSAAPQAPGVMVRSDTDVLQSSSLARSLSAPSRVDDDSVLDIIKLQRQRQARKKGPSSILQDLVESEIGEKPSHVLLIDQLFAFIGTHPETAISCEKFLKCAEVRCERGKYRQKAFIHMKSLLTAATRVGGATHLVSAVTSVLRHGPTAEELTCGGMVEQVREAFAETMAAVVELAAHNPIANCASITLMCTVPYTRAEERCLVLSGLVSLLDRLCGVTSQQAKPHSSRDAPSLNHHISAMAWAGFQVLASRCVTWETEDDTFDKLGHSGLARQVSTLLTHYLTRATEGAANEAASTEALQDVLGLLNNLARSRMGKAILSQPACVSKLLSLLLDQRPSPKLVLVILQLCRVALPLLNGVDCESIQLPSWGHHLLAAHWNTTQPISDTPDVIVSLLLAKLGDFLIPGDQVMLSSRTPSQEVAAAASQSATSREGDSDEGDMQDGRLSVFVHKRSDQMSNEALQPLLSSENRLFRLSSSASVDKVMRMDKEINKHGKAEVLTEDAMSALRKAYKWAQNGLVMSTGCPSSSSDAQRDGPDKKKTAAEEVCKERNSLLARTDPVRPFISSQVANSMAAETISLLHSLLNAPLSSTATTWVQAAHKVLANVLSGLPFLLNSLDSLSVSTYHIRNLMSIAKQVNAALCALGGFEETVKQGCHVQVMGEGVSGTTGTVVSVVTQTEMATVLLDTDPEGHPSPRYSNTIEVPLSRLLPIRNKLFSTLQEGMWDTVLQTVKTVLLPTDDRKPLPNQVLPVVGDGNSLANQICRVVAEIQTRTCTVLSLYLQDINFAKQFIDECEPAVDILKSLSKDCSAGKRLCVVASQCQRLRMLYRDCVKPPPPPSDSDSRTNIQMMWDPSRPHPPVRSCLFSQGVTAVTFLGDPSAGSSLPRGILIYANQPIPQQAPSFYWEIEICSFGDVQGESSPVVSFGFAPAAEKRDGAWTNPIGSCLIHNSGKAVHYNGASLLQWRSVRLDVTLEVGDVAGIGWEKTSDTSASTPKGKVYFTHKGQLLGPSLLDVAGGMFPVVHVQRKNVRVRANFGCRAFQYAEGQQHREAAEAASDLTREIRESFSHLPFHPTGSDSDGEETAASEDAEAADSTDVKTIPGPPCKTPASALPLKEYVTDACLQYKLQKSYSYMCSTGLKGGGVAPEEESDGEVEEEGANEDHYALLVRAWEQKVFPVVRRRFRNEAERKDGLEQIRGALQLGMTDIARQTVEFLYEENGGLPRDLHLPTIEDIKEDLSKFTIERVRKGKTVVISSPSKQGLPTFSVTSMMKTFGLAGTVLDIDTANELVQVETYVQTEGVMVRYWYPISSLEKPPKGFRKSSITGGQTLDTSTVAIHRELVQSEAVLVRMLLRQALLQLIDHCNSPAMGVSACSTGLGAGMAASAAGLQELDIQNLQLLSDHLLAPPSPTGGLVYTSLPRANALKQCLAPTTCMLTELLYKEPDRIKRELAIAIARAADQGEDYVIELTSQICQCLQNAPELFLMEEMSVKEVKVSTDVHFPGAACLLISCKTDPAVKKENIPYRSPWARIYNYSGKKVNKHGQATKQEVASYPMDNSGPSWGQQFMPVIIPGDRIHVKVGVAPPPGITLTLHALPQQFVMAVAYLETLTTEKFGCGLKACQKRKPEIPHPMKGSLEESHQSLWSLDNIVLSEGVLFHAVEMVCAYLRKTDIPSVIKEYMFHILAQALRILHTFTGRRHSMLSKFESTYVGVLNVFKQLQKELKVLYTNETKLFQHGSTCSGPGMGIGVTDHGVFTTYFHALLEVNLAVVEVLGCDKSFFQDTPSQSMSDELSPLSKSSSASKRKKQKPKKERHQAAPSSSSSSSSGTSGAASSADVDTSSSSDLLSYESSLSSLSSSSSACSPSSSSTSTVDENKTDEMVWFHRALSLSNILRVISLGEAFALPSLFNVIGDAARSLLIPTVHERLLVLSGISCHMDSDSIKQAVRTACEVCGGIDWDDIYVMQASVNTQLRSQSSSDNQTDATKPKETNQSYVVLNLPSKANSEVIQKSLAKSKVLVEGILDGDGASDNSGDFSVSTVSLALLAETNANRGLEMFLKSRLVGEKSDSSLRDEATHAATDIFYSCFFVCQQQGSPSERQESGFICLDVDQILFNSCENLLLTLFNSIRPPKKPLPDYVNQVLKQYGITVYPDKDISPTSSGPGKNGKPRSSKRSPRSSKEKLVLGKPVERPSSSKEKAPKLKEAQEKSSKETTASPDDTARASKVEKKKEVKVLTLEGFLQYFTEMIKHDVRLIWRALIACGLDIKLKRYACVDISQAQALCQQWTLEMDAALVLYVNELCRRLGLASARLHPHDILLSEAQLSSHKFGCLQDASPESIRLRFSLLQTLNNALETFFLPLVDLRPAQTFSCSTAFLLSKSRDFIFYDTKVNFFNRVLNATARRKEDQAAPEITLDPLEDITGDSRQSESTVFCQAFRQLHLVSSDQLCVRLASGGDPTYSFLVKLTGEEVHGTSGSFRQFLWQVAREMQSPALSMLIPCPSASNGVNKGESVLRPGHMTYQEEQLIQFFGQLLGVTVRADIPLGLELLATFWKCLLHQPLDPCDDLKQADILTYNYIKKIEMVETESELLALCSNTYPQFVYPTLDATADWELIPGGKHISVSWGNRQEYMDAIRRLRMKELCNQERNQAVVAGVASIIPVSLLTLFSPADLQMRTCGLPAVNLPFLKAHTMYQVGLMESDRHIEYFWLALEAFSQEELCRFIKFACNQERIPQTCPCQAGGPDTAHVPPYPMKIAPPDGPGPADARYIRVETCMFMIKLPQYSSLEIMSQRLKYAIHCREDPLSG